MTKLMLSAAAAGFFFSGTAAVLAQSANFEAKGFPITLHQAQITGLPDIQEAAPAPTMDASGMPASPHQLAVLSPTRGDPMQVVVKRDTDGGSGKNVKR
jgi:hypothetical protein